MCLSIHNKKGPVDRNERDIRKVYGTPELFGVTSVFLPPAGIVRRAERCTKMRLTPRHYLFVKIMIDFRDGQTDMYSLIMVKKFKCK